MPTWLGHVLKSGEVSLFTDHGKALQLKVENKKIDLNIIDRELLKVVLRSASEPKGKSLLDRLTQFKKIANELKDEGLTITISYEGGLVLTLGSDANPKLSKLITSTNAIEINNLIKLIQMGL